MSFALPRRGFNERARARTLAVAVAAPALVLTACGGGSADLDDLADTLMEVAELSESEATCVADELRANPDYLDEDVLTDLSDGTPDSDEAKALSEQFENDVATAVTGCLGAS